MADEKIGDFMVRIGALTGEQVKDILKKQEQEPHKLFGVIAIEMGYVNDTAIHQYIESKQKENE